MMNRVIGTANGREIEMAVNSEYEGLFQRNYDGIFTQLLGTGQFRDTTGRKLKRKIKNEFGKTVRVKYDMSLFTLQEQRN